MLQETWYFLVCLYTRLGKNKGILVLKTQLFLSKNAGQEYVLVRKKLRAFIHFIVTEIYKRIYIRRVNENRTIIYHLLYVYIYILNP